MVGEEGEGDAYAISQVFPSCAVTRAKTREMKDREEVLVNLADTLMSYLPNKNVEESNSHYSPSESLEADSRMSERDKLIIEQMKDHKLAKLAQEAVDNDKLAINPKCYFKQPGILMRKWRPRDVPATDTWRTVYQLVVLQFKRQNVLRMAHKTAMDGHLGVNKTYQQILNRFYWPKLC